MNVLLSIKPKYIKEMRAGNKKYEFRKNIWKNSTKVGKVYIYSSSPIKKIVGIFTLGNVYEDNPGNLWKNFKDFSGLDEEEFFNYFKNCEKGFAIEIKTIEFFDVPIDPFQDFSNFKPPQSFYYINKNNSSYMMCI
ncbi:MAG: hypothetical protein C5S46_01185 [Candidatus Methanomarinus sp.]|uniref:Uncharacterized protein n=1 Tax=Candidatus Methanomarinus sp. TaxID=3386244 RepID=A0AC61SCA1_9EURY|nr:MAG: hypothetical protein C5S46_01185 [ANME-2 cluster archaeon]